MILKGIVSEPDWPEIQNAISFDFTIDNHFEEFKEAEVLQNRIQLLQQVEPYIGRFFSDLWVRKNILKQTDDDIKQMMEEMQEEGSDVAQQEQEQQPEGPAPKPVSTIKTKPNLAIGTSR